MKVTRKHLQIAILSMGALLILYGVVKLIWKVNFGTWIEANLPNGIFIGAAVIFVWNRSLYNKEQKVKKDEEEAKQKALEAEASPPDPDEPQKDH
jgi:hypothetical protein